MTKVLLINGSPKREGNTYTALSEVAKELNKQGIETEIVHIGTRAVRGCIACNKCKEKMDGRCIFDDDICNTINEKATEADGFVFGSPVYYGIPNGSLISLMQRMLVSNGANISGKPVANVAICRRGGASFTYQVMNMPWMMMNCPIVTSQYWNIAYGGASGDAAYDAEGLQTMRTLALNMATMLKQLGGSLPPNQEEHLWTNFVRQDLANDVED